LAVLSWPARRAGGRERGYVLVDVSPELWRTGLRVVDTISRPEATARTLGSYVVEHGKAGAQEA
jgi:alkaline phosphatase D